MTAETDATIRQIEFELEKAEHGLAMPYDAERVGQLRMMLIEARKRKLSEGLARRLIPTLTMSDRRLPNRGGRWT
jgi:hypothetical protein